MQPSPSHHGLGLRNFALSRLPVRSLTLRPGDSLATLTMAVSMGFRASVSLRPAIQATRLLALAPTGLTPAEHVCLRWTHDEMKAAGLPLDVVAYRAPQGLHAVDAAERGAMDHIGIDVHKRESQICILAERGELIEQR